MQKSETRVGVVSLTPCIHMVRYIPKHRSNYVGSGIDQRRPKTTKESDVCYRDGMGSTTVKAKICGTRRCRGMVRGLLGSCKGWCRASTIRTGCWGMLHHQFRGMIVLGVNTCFQDAKGLLSSVSKP